MFLWIHSGNIVFKFNLVRHLANIHNIGVKWINCPHCKFKTKTKNTLKNHLARELLLIESSDWQFLITTWSNRDYAENRIALHYENFNRLYDIANKYTNGKNIDESELNFLGIIESVDDIFEASDLEPFAKK